MTALADLMDISQTEVYEVATFYHHFDIIKSGDECPPSLTIRVCDSVSCELNGAHELADELDNYYKGSVRIQKSALYWKMSECSSSSCEIQSYRSCKF